MPDGDRLGRAVEAFRAVATPGEPMARVQHVMGVQAALEAADGGEGGYRLWVNADSTVLVRAWESGVCEVATRDDSDGIWGPPVQMFEERH